MTLDIFIAWLQATPFDPATLVPWVVSIATPFVVKWATDLVVKMLPTLSGLKIVGVVVPILGGVVTALTYILTNLGPAWYVQLILSLVAVFVNEIWKQFKQSPVALKFGLRP